MTSTERAAKFLRDHLRVTGNAESIWAIEIQRHAASEFDAVAKEAAEAMRERCVEVAEGQVYGERLAQRIAAKIRVLPGKEPETPPCP